MKRNKPDNDDATHGTKCSLDRGDLSEWEYLTKFYDNDEMLDDHNISVATSHEVQLLPPNHMQSFMPSNLSFHESLNCEQSPHMDPKSIRPHDNDGDNNSGKAEVLPTSKSLSVEHSRYQLKVGSNKMSQIAVSSDHQLRTIHPPRYPDHQQLWTGNHNTPQQLLESESSSRALYPDGLSTNDTVFARSALLASQGQLPNSTESSAQSANRLDCDFTADNSFDRYKTQLTLRHDQSISEVNTYLPLEPWRMNQDRQIYDDQEPISILLEDDVTQHSDFECKSKSATLGKSPGEGSGNQQRSNNAIPDGCNFGRIQAVDESSHSMVAGIFHKNIGSNESLSYNIFETSTFDETISQPSTTVVTGNTHQQKPVRLESESQIVPPYKQLNDSSLLLKPLTPYNYYYRDERDNIVLQISGENDPLPPPVSDFSIEKMESLLKQHWYVDPVRAKRIHRKTHGKMSFQNLSKIISERWRALPTQGREFYRSVARSDEMYYNQHLMNLLSNDGSTESIPATSNEAEQDERKP
jgi:hypothetical protein